MDQKSENGTPTNGNVDDGSGRRDVCRDYLNKICNRGTRCKFYHPPGEGSNAPDAHEKEDFNFCIDFQNQGCYRENCRFVHATAQDVETYRQNGDVSNNLARAIAAVTKKDNINGIPFCKEFQTQRCSRGQRCRYWHVNVEMEKERRRNRQAPPIDHTPYGAPPMPLVRRRPGAELDSWNGPPPSKRFPPFPPKGPPQFYVQQLEQQNAELRRELANARQDLQRERERYDALLSAFNPAAAAQAPVPNQQLPSYGQQPPTAVPPPNQRAAWPVQQSEANEKAPPQWYNNY
ncbi:hypothetical protein M3Y94_00936800 [Aphelenchoides besseyi]|nr:hypothetical protein M3Y94_00936800 [Aphelenchoides besseyi]KAI6224941.1 hypothetical protein M3Y95_00805500 [Aphelenchoides besseyi]